MKQNPGIGNILAAGCNLCVILQDYRDRKVHLLAESFLVLAHEVILRLRIVITPAPV